MLIARYSCKGRLGGGEDEQDLNYILEKVIVIFAIRPFQYNNLYVDEIGELSIINVIQCGMIWLNISRKLHFTLLSKF